MCQWITDNKYFSKCIPILISKNIYILDYDWIRNWMVNSGYSSLKDQMESIYNSEDQNKITSLIIKIALYLIKQKILFRI